LRSRMPFRAGRRYEACARSKASPSPATALCRRRSKELLLNDPNEEARQAPPKWIARASRLSGETYRRRPTAGMAVSIFRGYS
jgi:hypothetical protein